MIGEGQETTRRALRSLQVRSIIPTAQAIKTSPLAMCEGDQHTCLVAANLTSMRGCTNKEDSEDA
jgi:hypothetical protein